MRVDSVKDEVQVVVAVLLREVRGEVFGRRGGQLRGRKGSFLAAGQRVQGRRKRGQEVVRPVDPH